MTEFMGKTFRDENGQLKQGHEYRILENVYGHDEIGILLRWKDGRLWDDGDLSAVEFQDSHCEHFRNGFLHNDKTDASGRLLPAVISDWGDKVEYYLMGKEVKREKNA